MSDSVRELDEAFVMDMADALPYLQPILKEHIKDQGELLPYLFMADAMRFAAELFESGDQRSVQRIADYLEHALEQDSQRLRDLIGAGFVESQPLPGEKGFGLAEFFGPRLSQFE